MKQRRGGAAAGSVLGAGEGVRGANKQRKRFNGIITVRVVNMHIIVMTNT